MAERRAEIEEELEAMEKIPKEEGNDGEVKSEIVRVVKTENIEVENVVDVEEERKIERSVVVSEDTRQVIFKEENGERIELEEHE